MSKQSSLQILQDIELPQSVIESYARFLLPEIRKYYESEEGQREFEHTGHHPASMPTAIPLPPAVTKTTRQLIG